MPITTTAEFEPWPIAVRIRQAAIAKCLEDAEIRAIHRDLAPASRRAIENACR